MDIILMVSFLVFIVDEAVNVADVCSGVESLTRG